MDQPSNKRQKRAHEAISARNEMDTPYKDNSLAQRPSPLVLDPMDEPTSSPEMPVIDLIYPTAEHTPTPSPSPRPQTPGNITREATDSTSSPEMRVIDLVYPTGYTPPKEPSPTPPHEKRLRRHHATAPYSFDKVYQRALTQRFYVLQRTPCGTEDCPAETFEMTGSTGNIYTVHINREPSCDCPHALGGNQCKHVILVCITSRVMNVADFLQILAKGCRRRLNLSTRMRC